MNRLESRKAEADARKDKELQRMPPAREDKRPQFYDINAGDHVVCYYCLRAGLKSLYRVGQAVMNDPANPPEGRPKGEMHTVCKHHLPEDAVIYNPRTNMCRNKAGDHTWEEAARQEVIPEIRN